MIVGIYKIVPRSGYDGNFQLFKVCFVSELWSFFSAKIYRGCPPRGVGCTWNDPRHVQKGPQLACELPLPSTLISRVENWECGCVSGQPPSSNFILFHK